jgi:acyl-CoA thioesterase
MTSFDQATRLTSTGEEAVWSGTLGRDWWGGVGPHGGYLAAIMVRGLELGGGADGRRRPRSLTIHYARSPREGPFQLRAHVEREGRALSNVALRLVQGGTTAVAALGVVAAGRSGPELAQLQMPQVPPWQEVEPSEFPAMTRVPVAQRIEYRHCIGPGPLGRASEAESGGWIRLRERRPLDAAAAALYMDAWWPAIWVRLREIPRAPTLDLTLHFRRSLPPTDEPVLARLRSRLVVEGFMDEEGELWSATGELLVQSRQLALLLVPPGAL